MAIFVVWVWVFWKSMGHLPDLQEDMKFAVLFIVIISVYFFALRNIKIAFMSRPTWDEYKKKINLLQKCNYLPLFKICGTA